MSWLDRNSMHTGNFYFHIAANSSVCLSEVKKMQLKDETILAIGMISIALGILIGRFLHFEYAGFSITDFLEGVLVGLSLVMNLAYLVRRRK
jgi:hypothetical protein